MQDSKKKRKKVIVRKTRKTITHEQKVFKSYPICSHKHTCSDLDFTLTCMVPIESWYTPVWNQSGPVIGSTARGDQQNLIAIVHFSSSLALLAAAVLLQNTFSYPLGTQCCIPK